MNCTQATATLSEALADTVKVPLTVCPPVGEVIETDGGTLSTNKIVRDVDWELVPTFPVSVADCDAVTTAADAVKVAVDIPEATVTEAGTASALGLLFVSETAVPPEGDN